jgi:hypothetical protein
MPFQEIIPQAVKVLDRFLVDRLNRDARSV